MLFPDSSCDRGARPGLHSVTTSRYPVRAFRGMRDVAAPSSLHAAREAKVPCRVPYLFN